MRDIHQHALQFVEHAGDLRIAGMRGGLPVEAGFGDQVAGALLFVELISSEPFGLALASSISTICERSR